ncbi:MAG: pyrroline-5-carboxylate reductase [Betaproteobacteria bacterium]|nr:pyrroline-5-carboxylate reductase [Betaproteobacteria bacterium]
MSSQTPASTNPRIAFIGGGNMASAIIGGLIRNGWAAQAIDVVEPLEAARERLVREFGVRAHAEAGAFLADAGVIVWAVKPQTFKQAAQAVRPHAGAALHLSVAAGIRSDSIARWLDSARVVRSMPNTPALVGKGMTGLFARDGVTEAHKALVEALLAPTGELLWVAQESDLDTVTALSGSGPAYVFFFIEAMTQAGVDMGLSAAQAQQLAVGTFVGASELARTSSEPPSVLRERVTSRGGTTHAAITSMQADEVGQRFARALQAARARARELGDEFGA